MNAYNWQWPTIFDKMLKEILLKFRLTRWQLVYVWMWFCAEHICPPPPVEPWTQHHTHWTDHKKCQQLWGNGISTWSEWGTRVFLKLQKSSKNYSLMQTNSKAHLLVYLLHEQLVTPDKDGKFFLECNLTEYITM